MKNPIDSVKVGGMHNINQVLIPIYNFFKSEKSFTLIHVVDFCLVVFAKI
jgi:hypothetical protein